jgi:hypothetical protein
VVKWSNHRTTNGIICRQPPSRVPEPVIKTTAGQVIGDSPGRNFVTLKIETDEVVCGIGSGGFRLIRQHTVTLIAVGEIFNTIYYCQTLITE